MVKEKVRELSLGLMIMMHQMLEGNMLVSGKIISGGTEQCIP